MNLKDESRDYDVRQLKELDDERFVITLREAIFSELFFMGTILAEMIAAYILCPEDMSLMTYIMGFPTWFFVATCIAFISWAFVLYHNAKISKDFSLDARIESRDFKNEKLGECEE